MQDNPYGRFFYLIIWCETGWKTLKFPTFRGMNLQTEIAHIGLRPLTSQDLPDLVRHANNPNIARFLRDRFPSPYTDQDARTYLEMQPVEGTPQNLAITDRGHLIGMIGVIPQEDVYRLNAEFGYWVSEDFWRQGIATAAIKVFVPWVFSQTDLVRLYAHVFDYNPASKRVLEKAGFSFEGIARHAVVKGNVIYDEYRYAVLRSSVYED